MEASSLNVNRRSLYDSLPTNAIRVLELLPGEQDDVIHSRLQTKEFKDEPTYEGLSYAWGDASEPVKIMCSGVEMMVGRNLAGALHHIRDETESRYIWADAICINQNDMEERSQQVQMMDRIYRTASKVIIWLGADRSGEWYQGFRHIATLADESKELAQSFERGDMTRNDYQAAILKVYNDVNKRGIWDTLFKLTCKSWFTRVWVLQEVGVARAKDLWCGHSKLKWASLLSAAQFLFLHSPKSAQARNSLPLQKILFMERLYHGKEFSSFLDVLDGGRAWDASDPRDKVYAFLGHPAVVDYVSAGEKASASITPNYKKCVEEVYIDTALAIITKTASLNILSTVIHSEREVIDATVFPSWVPRWNVRSGNSTLGTCAWQSIYSADGGSVPFIVRSPDRKILIARGIMLQEVEWVSKVSRLSQFGAESVAHLWKSSNCQEQEEDGSPYENLLTAFSLTVVANRTRAVETNSRTSWTPYSPYSPHHYADFLRYWMTFGTESKGIDGLRQLAAAPRSWNDFALNARDMCAGKRLFRALDGHLGLGPANMQPGDRVCVLLGARVPFVVRCNGDHWHLVGECYYHGFMNGEAVEMSEDGQLSTEEIELH
ncbi:HET-domain-containing protein [Tothia fuscella]|uniref:HET-domain-containing protein n=1 Tax=Tothia fuscella TaxID=1048955 RepID=A0A9P4NYT4_9PEZI|nr:HET-domain-containing protein [Tothia fuscella]